MKTINKGTAQLFHAAGKPYTSISNKVVESISNPDALAIWTFLQTKDNHWTVIASWLQKHFGIGRDRYARAMALLESMGLIRYEINRCEKTGKLAGTRIIVNFEPIIADTTEMSENPHVGKPTRRSTHESGKQQLPIKDSIPTKDSTNNSLSSKPDDMRATAKRIIDYLNEKTQSKFKHSDSHLKLIIARLRAGACEDEIKQVVDRKCAEWIRNPEMRQYLRPGTLFTPKNYDNYVGHLDQPLPQSMQPRTGALHNNFGQQNYHEGVSADGSF